MMASGQGLKKGVQKSKFRGENTSAQKCTERGLARCWPSLKTFANDEDKNRAVEYHLVIVVPHPRPPAREDGGIFGPGSKGVIGLYGFISTYFSLGPTSEGARCHGSVVKKMIWGYLSLGGSTSRVDGDFSCGLTTSVRFFYHTE